MTADHDDVFGAGGEVGRDLRAVDWEATPLGHPGTWPQSLRAVVRILLSSRFSMWMAWGPKNTFFCNEAYRRDTLGTKYPWALGKPAQEVWAEIWPDIGPRIEQVMRTGTATWDEALLLFLERSGYTEETYHTFSYSPLTDDHGHVSGMLCVVSEDTERIVSARRMATLREMGADAGTVRGEAEVFEVARRHLEANTQSLPFTLTYLFDDADGPAPTARLVSSSGVPDGHPAAPPLIAVAEPATCWPAAALLDATPVTMDDLPDRFPDLPTGAWHEPPLQARVVPLLPQGKGRPYGFLVVGANRFRPLDEGYLGFLDLVAGQIAAGIASARAYETERRRAEELAELDRAKTTFFTNVSHEFRTPLTLLLGPADDALRDGVHPMPEEQRRRVEIVHRNAQRLLKLVNTLLDFSQVESGRIRAHFEPVDLAQYTADLVSTFRAAVERAGLTLTVACPPLGEPTYVDPEMWAKIVLNLMSNAVKFTFTGGITVSLQGVDGAVELAVTDTGTGIEPAEQARLFERFHRVVGARSRTHEGSGIGLALVAELAALHGGTTDVSSVPGEGSSFTVRLPRGAGHLPPDHVVEPGASSLAGPGQHAQGFLAEALRWLDSSEELLPDVAESPRSADDAAARPRVLVVDDNADMREYVIRLLGSRYTVESATDGADGLERARAHPPDLVLTDVMMPRLDGFELMRALRADPATARVPVVMLSARAGEEATVEGLEAGADDYLVKPFAARELLARIRANLELDRVRRARTEMERQQVLLDQAQRLSGVGSWELDLRTEEITGSAEFLRHLQMSAEELRTIGLDAAITARVHPDDADRIAAAIAAAAEGAPLDYEVRLVHPDGQVRMYHTLGLPERDEDGRTIRLRGSHQDITEQRQAEKALASAAAGQEAALREHRIADELQRSLLPPPTFDPDHLRVATYYRAGVEGTQVGGDWYDVIELGAGRTALVMGDVMGRGVRAAAVMGQLRTALRAYARLDLRPGDALEFLDGVVRDLGEDQIVTCVYAVFDPGDRSFTYANAGHLPPLLVTPGAPTRRLTVAGPPLGTGLLSLDEDRVELPVGAVLALYTDGLVEHRNGDLDVGINRLAALLGETTAAVEKVPEALAQALLTEGPDDDVAVLLARVHDEEQRGLTAVWQVPDDESAVRPAREFVSATLRDWGTPERLAADVVLLASELVTNAVLYGLPPIELRLRRGRDHVVLEVRDGAAYLPRRLRPTPEDEHGRGLQLVARLAERWGTRPTPDGKSVWCVLPLSAEGSRAAATALSQMLDASLET